MNSNIKLLFVFFAGWLFLASCASSSQTFKSKRLASTQSKMQMRSGAEQKNNNNTNHDNLDFIREQNRVRLANRRYKINSNKSSVPPFTSRSSEFTQASGSGVANQSRKISYYSKMKEKDLIQSLNEAYELNNSFAFESAYTVFQKRFNQSKAFAEATYQRGLLHLSNRNYGLALKSFDSILKKLPQAPQAAQALFAKGVVFQRMGFTSPARGLFEETQRKYPKSFEAQRARVELEILEKKYQ